MEVNVNILGPLHSSSLTDIFSLERIWGHQTKSTSSGFRTDKRSFIKKHLWNSLSLVDHCERWDVGQDVPPLRPSHAISNQLVFRNSSSCLQQDSLHIPPVSFTKTIKQHTHQFNAVPGGVILRVLSFCFTVAVWRKEAQTECSAESPEQASIASSSNCTPLNWQLQKIRAFCCESYKIIGIYDT